MRTYHIRLNAKRVVGRGFGNAIAMALALLPADGARRPDVAGGRMRRLPLRPATSRADPTVWRPPGASRVSSRTQLIE